MRQWQSEMEAVSLKGGHERSDGQLWEVLHDMYWTAILLSSFQMASLEFLVDKHDI